MSPEELLAHAHWVRTLARALLVDTSQVDDVVQMTWLTALKNPPQSDVNLRAWLAGVTRNVSRQLTRSNQRRQRRESRGSSSLPLPSPDELVEKADLQRRLVRSVTDLPEPFRSTLLLRFMEDLTCEEIARREGIPSSTVRNRLKRALDRLRVAMDDRHEGDRRGWCLSLIPIALSATEQTAVVLPTAGTTASVSGGFLLMTTKIIATVLVLGALIAFLIQQTTDPESGSTAQTASLTPPGTTPPSAPELSSAKTTPLTNPDLAQAPRSHGAGNEILGTVTDREGEPVAGARVFVGAEKSPFGSEGNVRLAGEPGLEEVGIAIGKTLISDEKGAFSVSLDSPGRVFVSLQPSPGIRPSASGGIWVESPGRADFTADRFATATVTLKVWDAELREHIAPFRYSIARQGERPFSWSVSPHPRTKVLLELREAREETFTFQLVQPTSTGAEIRVLVRPGAEQTAEILLSREPGIRGRVVDSSGQPVENALVYWGLQERIRGDEPFKPFQEKRILDGARTETDGVFQLFGTGRNVTVYHPRHSPVTVSVERAFTISLPFEARFKGASSTRKEGLSPIDASPWIEYAARPRVPMEDSGSTTSPPASEACPPKRVSSTPCR